MNAHRSATQTCRRYLYALWVGFAAFAVCGTAQACTGKLADLQAYAGKYLADSNLLATPAIAALVQRLPANERTHLQRSLDVAGPIERHACHLVVAGNAPHMGTEQDAILDVDLASGTLVAGIHDGGRIDIYVLTEAATGRPDWQSLPHDVRLWAVRADMGFPSENPRTLAQPRTVRLHTPPASATADTATPATRSSGYPLKIQFDKDRITPTAAQMAAIRRAAASDIRDFNHPEQNGFTVATADLNDDGRPDLLVQYSDGAFCGSSGCSGLILMATANDYAGQRLADLPNFYGEIDVLASKHHGMHDLQYNGDSPIWRWNGKAYDIAKADRPLANAPAWVTHQAAGHPMMAVATPIDSTIKNLLVFCEQGAPLLAMVTKVDRPAAPVTLTFVFRGWTVNVPMQPNTQAPRLWVANLSRSDLPLWLAHRGSNATTNELARLADMAFLRVNGGMQGEIALKDSTAATQAALAGCYRY